MSATPSLVLTLASPTPLRDADIAVLAGAQAWTRLGPAAIDIWGHHRDDHAAILDRLQTDTIDHALQPVEGREKSVLICDMDSTIIGQECLDELAALAGCGAEIAAVTERAMRGELDFETALKARVAKLAGVDAALIHQVIAERLTLTPGAETLVRTMAARGALTALVSGGFTPFTAAIAERAGFAHHRGNQLVIDANDTLTGEVSPPILGKDAKRLALLDFCRDQVVSPQAALAIGDGANDLAMIDTAGLGLAYNAKPVVAAAADAAIRHTDLNTALFFQGLKTSDFTCS